MVQQTRMISRSPNLNVMANAAFKAGRSLIRDFGEVEHLQVSTKGPGDFVSIADKKAEDILYRELSKARPGYSFLMEESGAKKGEEDYTWIIDPLDGTTNFLHGLPHFAISIGLQHGDELIAGVVYDPIKDELFYAEKGGGAFLNERRLRVSSRKNLAESVIATGIPFILHDAAEHKRFQTTLAKIAPLITGIRRFGSASLDLAYVAAGRFDGYWESILKPWDMAAGIVIIREAGGYVSDLQGEENMLKTGTIFASNHALQGPLKEILISKV